MFNHHNPCWAKFVNFWTALLRMGLSDKEDCIYVMQHIPSIAANAWLNFCESVPTKDELCFIMEWVKDIDIRIHAWDEFIKLEPEAEDFRYMIQWIPDMRVLAGVAWITTKITPSDLVYVFEHVPEIPPRLGKEELKMVILAADSSVTKAQAGMILLKRSQSIDTLIFIKDNVPALESVVASLAEKIIPKKRPVGFVEPQTVKSKKKQPIGFVAPGTTKPKVPKKQ